MLLNNQGLWLTGAQEHGEELRREAAMHRLLRQHRPTQVNRLDRLSTWLGALLVTAGTRLQARQAPGFPTATRQSF